ncbi:MAG: hypothetical protein KJ714_05010, partial [Euryarchaeota archaeon]|nr:hypothetical protein [Euryarchaeota archaeon]
PFLEKDSDNPRGVLGTFDVSARPYVPENMLTISITIIENMEESFLITESWKKVQRRITAARK